MNDPRQHGTYQMVRNPSPKRLVSSSPGLRVIELPWVTKGLPSNPEGIASRSVFRGTAGRSPIPPHSPKSPKLPLARLINTRILPGRQSPRHSPHTACIAMTVLAHASSTTRRRRIRPNSTKFDQIKPARPSALYVAPYVPCILALPYHTSESGRAMRDFT
jgi:hypothetical protein